MGQTAQRHVSDPAADGAGVRVHAAGGAVGLGRLLPLQVGPALILPRPCARVVLGRLGATTHCAGEG